MGESWGEVVNFARREFVSEYSMSCRAIVESRLNAWYCAPPALNMRHPAFRAVDWLIGMGRWSYKDVCVVSCYGKSAQLLDYLTERCPCTEQLPRDVFNAIPEWEDVGPPTWAEMRTQPMRIPRRVTVRIPSEGSDVMLFDDRGEVMRPELYQMCEVGPSRSPRWDDCAALPRCLSELEGPLSDLTNVAEHGSYSGGRGLVDLSSDTSGAPVDEADVSGVVEGTLEPALLQIECSGAGWDVVVLDAGLRGLARQSGVGGVNQLDWLRAAGLVGDPLAHLEHLICNRYAPVLELVAAFRELQLPASDWAPLDERR